jgi:3-oxoacyl-(acyl-carrier-protein) synthase
LLGTGTAIGDPTEARAIGETFMKYRSPEDPLYVYALFYKRSSTWHFADNRLAEP